MNWWLYAAVAIVAVIILVVGGTRRAAARGERPVRLWFLIPLALAGILAVFASWKLN